MKGGYLMKQAGIIGKGFGGILITFGVLVAIGAIEMIITANGFSEVMGIAFMGGAIYLIGIGVRCFIESCLMTLRGTEETEDDFGFVEIWP